jgi:nucleotide-binding universal stress UspA family protein
VRRTAGKGPRGRGGTVIASDGGSTIVVGYDDSEAAKRALERAAMLAKAFGSTVIVTSVAPVGASGPRGGAGAVDPSDPPELHAAELTSAQEALSAQGVASEAVAAVGDPAEAIVTLANDRGADLIVVGTRELGFMQRMLGQSVSAAVTRHAPCDVLIVH